MFVPFGLIPYDFEVVSILSILRWRHYVAGGWHCVHNLAYPDRGRWQSFLLAWPKRTCHLEVNIELEAPQVGRNATVGPTDLFDYT